MMIPRMGKNDPGWGQNTVASIVFITVAFFSKDFRLKESFCLFCTGNGESLEKKKGGVMTSLCTGV